MTEDFRLEWEDVDGMLMPTISHPNLPFEVKTEPNWVTFKYSKESGDETFFSIPMEDWIKLDAVIGIAQTIMLTNMRKKLEDVSCACVENGDGCCNGDCHC